MPSEWPGEHHSICLNWTSLHFDWARSLHGTFALQSVRRLSVYPYCGIYIHDPSAKQRALLDCGHACHIIHGLQGSQHCAVALSSLDRHQPLAHRAGYWLLIWRSSYNLQHFPFMSIVCAFIFFTPLHETNTILFPEENLRIAYSANVYLIFSNE